MRRLLALLALSVPASAAVPPAFAPVLARHAVDEPSLRALGVDCGPERCVRDGRPLTPEELDALLAPVPALPARPARTEPPAPRKAVALPAVPLAALDGVFDGRAASARADATAAAAAPAAAPETPPAWMEPPFDASWTEIDAGLSSPKRRARALRRLSARFAAAEDSPTGLSDDAPEALRLLAGAIHDGRGGPAAAGELRRELALAAGLKPEQKAAFARRLQSPLIAFMAISRSRAPHALDARLYFARMERLLAARGLSLPQFVAAEDPRGRDAAAFFLRAHAYDLLLPRLTAHPQEAGALAAWLFPDDRAAAVAHERAAQLEGLMTQLAAQGRGSGALAAFVAGLEARAAAAPEASARRVAAFLLVNERLLPRALRPGVHAQAARLPPGLLQGAGLTPADPYDLWPADRWTFTLHFASTSSYAGFLSNFRARGWRPAPASQGGAALRKTFGPLAVTLRATLHPGDKDGFLRGAEARRYLAAVTRDLRDPAVQGVFLRNHAQFRVVGLFDRKVSPGKLLLDGACRSAWDLQSLRRRCPTCQFIVNTGTGVGHVNNEAVAAIVEGLARRDDWSDIGAAWERQMPRSAARIQGPWTPAFDEALKALDAAEPAS